MYVKNLDAKMQSKAFFLSDPVSSNLPDKSETSREESYSCC